MEQFTLQLTGTVREKVKFFIYTYIYINFTDFWFQFWHIKSVQVITPIHKTRKSSTSWRMNGFSCSFRKLRFQGKTPPQIWRDRWMQKVKVQTFRDLFEVRSLNQGDEVVRSAHRFTGLPLGNSPGSNGKDHRNVPSWTWWEGWGKKSL